MDQTDMHTATRRRMVKGCLIRTVVGAWVMCASAGAHAGLIHYFELNGNYNDILTPLTLVPSNPARSSPFFNPSNTAYSLINNRHGFPVFTYTHEGLSLSNGLTSNSTYSILIDFQFSTLSSYKKVLDFKNLLYDYGLYTNDRKLDFYGAGSGSQSGNVFTTDTLARLVLTRGLEPDGYNYVTGYVNGVQAIRFRDNSNYAVFNGTNSIIQFFNDDNATNGLTSPGLVDRIAIYDSPLGPTDVSKLGGPGPLDYGQTAIPEPSSWLLMGLAVSGLMGYGGRRRFQSRRKSVLRDSSGSG